MESLDCTAYERPDSVLKLAAAGFNHNGRAAASSKDLCAALLAIASHDLRQPLQVIRGAHDILTKTLDGAVERAQLIRVERATAKLTANLDQLMDALQLFEQSSGSHQQVVSLRPIFALFEAEFAEKAQHRGVRLRFVPTRAIVSSNAVLLSGILRNLIDNALDYTQSGGSVLVAARSSHGTVRLEVRDNGVGIPSRNLADIFKPFHRIDRTRAEGLGLGLFIVKCAAAFLGHDIEVDSAPGRGSRFVVAVNSAPAALQPPPLNANSCSRDWALTRLR
jgi:two-component system, OmpR family, phosphate regulon sensor histidine kinase PhoR